MFYAYINLIYIYFINCLSKFKFIFIFTKLLDKNPGGPDTTKNNKKEKAKNWLIKSIQKSIQGMEKVIHAIKKIFKK